MSLVSHDSIWTKNYGVDYGINYEDFQKNNNDSKIAEKEQNVTIEDKFSVKEEVKDRNQNVEQLKKNTSDIKVNENNPVRKIERSSTKVLKKGANVQSKENVQIVYTNTLKEKVKHKNGDNSKIYSTNSTDKLKLKNGNNINLEINKNYEERNENLEKYKNRHKPFQRLQSLKTCARNALKETNNNSRIPKWNSGVLISLVILNLAGGYAEETSSFSSGLTSRMIASFLGYSSTCTLGNEVRPCSLTLSCWLRGGTRLRGCGGWLFSCCGPPESGPDTLSNSISSSEWKYKPFPPKLRQVPQRNGMPNNVFRRRVDEDATQLECGLPSSRILQKRIIGGREARFAEFPWQAHVRISEFQCGGVLVSRRYVATAAHCVSRAHTRDIAVWLGAIDTSATHHPARKLGVIQKILHPLFQFRMTQPDRYDIALLKLSRPITYMTHILPICLPDYDMDLRGRSGVIAGWGKTDATNGHTGTNLLRSATVPILSKEQCIIWHQSKQISVEIHSEMICAGHSDGHQDACLGDSGGPLIVLDNGRYYLVGITSAGFGCGVDHQPGIYHNVKLTANWIRSVIAPPSVGYNDNYLRK